MAGLAETLGEVYQPKRQTKCGVALLLQHLEPADRNALQGALDDSSLAHKAIAKWLVKHGYTLSYDSIRRHRNRGAGEGCLCPREATDGA